MKESDAQAFLQDKGNSGAGALLKKAVGGGNYERYSLQLGRLELFTQPDMTPEQIENDDGWCVLGIDRRTLGIEPDGRTYAENVRHVVKDAGTIVGWAFMTGPNGPLAGHWQYAK